jgi:flagellar basal-body rod protein FlgG
MLRAMYSAGTVMIAQNRRMEVVANNLANVETIGFKSDTLATRSFREMLISRINDPSIHTYRYVGPHSTGIHADQVYTSFIGGSMMETRQNNDLALLGDGFFVIDNQGAEAYTRAGNFSVDAAGYLVTGDGGFVMGTNGRLNVGTTDFQVHTDGTVTVGDQIVDRLLLVQFADNAALRKQGGNLFFNFEPAGNPALPADADLIVRQGFLEASNVDSAREVVNMIEIQRHFELNQRVLRMLDETLGRAVNDIGRIG